MGVDIRPQPFNFVPYSGANADVDLGLHTITAAEVISSYFQAPLIHVGLWWPLYLQHDGGNIVLGADYLTNGFVKTSGGTGTLTIDSNAYLTDAPADGSRYARLNAAWAVVNNGDVIGPASNTDGYIPLWNGADSKTLKGGIQDDSYYWGLAWTTANAINNISGILISDGASNFTTTPDNHADWDAAYNMLSDVTINTSLTVVTSVDFVNQTVTTSTLNFNAEGRLVSIT